VLHPNPGRIGDAEAALRSGSGAAPGRQYSPGAVQFVHSTAITCSGQSGPVEPKLPEVGLERTTFSNDGQKPVKIDVLRVYLSLSALRGCRLAACWVYIWLLRPVSLTVCKPRSKLPPSLALFDGLAVINQLKHQAAMAA
jgi:hypothetical protein